MPDGEEGHAAEARLAALREGERQLQRAVAMRPRDMMPRVMLLRNLMLQDHGSEGRVPDLALSALAELSPIDADIAFTPQFVPAMQIVLLAVKALWKQGQEAGVPAFISAASERLPSMASDFGHLAERVEAQLTGGAWCEGGASADGLREEMLASHRWLSCIDLQAVDGRHHKSSPGLLSMDAF
ncbi:hypothetical protein MNEG_4799 [Monoraphidium neglectum]|uniref:Uncharacterized protein n=1 Tax=Monoraphidium neglectum TaxID=145388 RepID=A0A0D2MJM3_9CHLO|nr:hypothetical protein MNEG_4799 [Monoraphidium neglectum]KIZ03165.1 hypothetical protein MNEG_4799 [Monoraphidium neglectum]|eukprot:XP_013902184.1 hypothetical protein MNEG_4799 [Monoraphidium neglectum]